MVRSVFYMGLVHHTMWWRGGGALCQDPYRREQWKDGAVWHKLSPTEGVCSIVLGLAVSTVSFLQRVCAFSGIPEPHLICP